MNQTTYRHIVMLIIGVVLGYGIASYVRPAAPHTSTTMSMADMMRAMSHDLDGKTADEFDRSFLAEMIPHHEGAVVMAEAALTNAKHQEIKDLAQGIIAAQNKEIAEMQSWQEAWYGQQ